jgi:hypothetical protein
MDPLLAQHGANMPLPELLRIITADYPKMQAGRVHDDCNSFAR